MPEISTETTVLRIKEALRKIDANRLQRLAEAIATLDWPDRFRDQQLILQGRNVEQQTTKGWPDAFSDAGGGKIHAIEATRERQSWKRHLDADLKKAAASSYPSLASYFFVGGYPDHESSASDLTAYREKFTALGLQAKDVNILVGHDLANKLAAPRYAQIRQSLLQVPVTPRIVRILIPGRIGCDTMTEFQPDEQDFATGRVWKDPLVDTVLSDLHRGEAALVRGYGASGKTTFAQSVCRELLPRPTFYHDLTDDVGSSNAGTSDLLADMTEFAGPGVTFIIDNIHLAEAQARRTFDHWREFAKPLGSALLLLGRELSSPKGSPVGALPARLLQATEQTLHGVVQRLLAANGYAGVEIPAPVLRQWSETFGGGNSRAERTVDLIAFAAAAKRRLFDLAQGRFELREEDAVAIVRERYLAPLSPPERLNLQRLAVVNQYEVSLATESIPSQYEAFEVARNRFGLVIQEQVGRDRRQVYRLAHPALGRLILQASADVSAAQLLRDVARDAPAAALQVLGRMEEGDSERALLRDALSETFASAGWIGNAANLAALHYMVKAAPYLRVADRSRLHHQLCQSSRFETLYRNERSLASLNDLQEILTRKGQTPPIKLIAELTCRNLPHFTAMLERSPIDQVRLFVKTNPEGLQVLNAIDEAGWRRGQSLLPQLAPTIVISAIRTFEDWGCTALAAISADLLIRNPEPASWELPEARADLSHLSNALRIGAGVDLRLREEFLAKIARPEWLDGQFSRAKTGTIAGSLMSLANYLPQQSLRVFHRPQLAVEIRRRLMEVGGTTPTKAAPGLCLLGAGSAIGYRPDLLTHRSWPDERLIARLIGFWNRINPGLLGTYELQFWLGIRAMMPWRGQPLALPAGPSAQFLSRLERSEPPSEDARQVSKGLIDWMKQVATRGWVASAIAAPT